MKNQKIVASLLAGACLCYGAAAQAADATFTKEVTFSLVGGGCNISTPDNSLVLADYVINSGADKALPSPSSATRFPISALSPAQYHRVPFTIACDDAQTVSVIRVGYFGVPGAVYSGWENATSKIKYQAFVPTTATANSGATETDWVPHHQFLTSSIPIAAGGTYTNQFIIAVNRTGATTATVQQIGMYLVY